MENAPFLDECLDRLHEALHRGERPMAAGQSPHADVPLTLLVELVHAELEFRLKRGEGCRIEEYRERYPALGDASNADALVGLIVAEANFRRRFEAQLGDAEYYERFPEHRAALEDQLSSLIGGAGRFPEVPGYEILAELGRGGMGVVYEARQRALGRLVALKLVLDGGALGSEEASRLRVEAQAIAGLQHPNVVRLYEVGAHAGCSYLALEYVQGVNLEAYCADRSMPPREAAALVETLARAVEHAHRSGILHRDLKPANILMQPREDAMASADLAASPRAAAFIAKIVDFGLARLRDGSGLTHTGQMLGTPGYMAPEQVAGAAGTPGPGVDIYALGAILYRLIAGAPPFPAATPEEALRRQASDEPAPLRGLQRSTPRDLEVICHKCLARDPSRRYASAQDVADELQHFLAGEPIAARPAGIGERTIKWARRRPWLAASCAVGMAAVASAIGGLAWHDARLGEAIERAEKRLLQEQQQLSAEREATARALAEADRLNAYVGDMRTGDRLLQSGDVPALHEMLARHLPNATDPIDRRGFEWRYFAHCARAAPVWWRAHDDRIALVAYAEDGKTLVTASARPHNVKVWDLATGKVRIQLTGSGFDWCVAAMPAGGRNIAYVSEGNHVRIADLAGRPVTVIDHNHVVGGLGFTADGQHVMSCAGGATYVRGCNDLPATPLKAKLPHDLNRLAPAALPGTSLIALTVRAGVEVWDYRTNRLAWKITCQKNPTANISFPRRSWLVTAQGAAPILVSNQRGGRVTELALTGRAVHALALSCDERLLAVGAEDGSVHLWDTRFWRLVGVMRWQSSPIHALAFAPNGRELAAGTANGCLYRMEVGEALVPDLLAPTPHVDGPAAFSSDSRTLAVGTSDGGVAIMDAADGQTRRMLTGDGEPLRMVTFAPDRDQLAALSRDSGAVRIWDVATGRCVHEFWEAPGRSVVCVALAPRSPVLATGGTVPLITLWNTETGKRLGRLDAGSDGVQALAFAPRGHVLAGVSVNGTLRFWDLTPSLPPQAAPNTPLAPCFRAEAGNDCYALAWSPDGKTLAVGTKTGLARY